MLESNMLEDYSVIELEEMLKARRESLKNLQAKESERIEEIRIIKREIIKKEDQVREDNREDNMKEIMNSSVRSFKFGRIKKGAHISQDFAYYHWPDCRSVVAAEMIFLVEERENYLNCSADGFGFGTEGLPEGKYGNGSIFLFEKDKIEFINQK